MYIKFTSTAITDILMKLLVVLCILIFIRIPFMLTYSVKALDQELIYNQYRRSMDVDTRPIDISYDAVEIMVRLFDYDSYGGIRKEYREDFKIFHKKYMEINLLELKQNIQTIN